MVEGLEETEEKGCVGLNTLICVTVWEHFCWGLKGWNFVWDAMSQP